MTGSGGAQMLQERRAGARQMAVAMLGALVLVAGLMLAGMPGENRVCQLQLSGPLAGGCAAR